MREQRNGRYLRSNIRVPWQSGMERRRTHWTFTSSHCSPSSPFLRVTAEALSQLALIHPAVFREGGGGGGTDGNSGNIRLAHYAEIDVDKFDALAARNTRLRAIPL